MTKLILSFAVLALFAGCRGNAKKTATEQQAAEVPEVVVADSHNANNSLDYGGTYRGVLPCADCEGIQTEVIIDYEGNMVIRSTYLTEKDGQKTFEEQGKYTWNDAGNVINMFGSNKEPVKYFVSENALTLLDVDGNRIEGELAPKYVLKKVVE